VNGGKRIAIKKPGRRLPRLFCYLDFFFLRHSHAAIAIGSSAPHPVKPIELPQPPFSCGGDRGRRPRRVQSVLKITKREIGEPFRDIKTEEQS
jgi:hypothetical protein